MRNSFAVILFNTEFKAVKRLFICRQKKLLTVDYVELKQFVKKMNI